MHSLLAWVAKEAREGARSYRFLILAIAAAFFAFLDPVMLKLLPLIMEARVGVDLGSLVPATRAFAFETLLGDLFEILSFVVCVVLGGSVARERKERALVIPRSKGASVAGIVAAKILVWAAYLAVLVTATVLVSYVYAGVLFPPDASDFRIALRAALHLALYFAWVVALVVFMSTLTKSPAVATLLALAVVYGLPALGSLTTVGRYFPSYLALGSASLALLAQGGFLPAALCSACVLVALWLCSSAVLRKVEP